MKRLSLVAGILLLGILASCGGGGSAAPSDSGGGGVIAVEIPALGDISGLPYASGVVITGSSSLSAPLKSVGKSVFDISKSVPIEGNPFTSPNMGYQSCKMFNSVGLMTDAMLRSDVNTCIMKAVATKAESAGVDMYSGSDVIYSVEITGNADAPNKFKVNASRSSSNIITQSTLYGCNSTENNSITYQKYAISGDAVSIYAKGYDPISNLNRSVITVDGTVSTSNTTQFVDSKSGTFRFYGDSLMDGVDTGTGLMTQYPGNVVVNTLFGPGGSPHLVGSADFSNATSGATFSGKAWEMGAGAATFTQYDVATTGCWEGTALLPVTCLADDSNYLAMSSELSTMPVILYDVYAFSADELWDCQGEDTFTVADYETEVNSCIERFSMDWSEVDCSALDTTDEWLLQVADPSGASLSTTEGSYTDIDSESGGYLYISTNWAADTTSFDDTTVQLMNLTTDAAETLYGWSWNGDQDILTIIYPVSSQNNFRLTVVGGASGVKSASGSTFATNKVYYFMTDGGYVAPVNNWTVLSVTPSGGNAVPSETPLAVDGTTTNVSTATALFAVTFSEAMDASTLTAETVTMSCLDDGVETSVSGAVEAAESPANTYAFIPDAALEPLETCWLAISGGSGGAKTSEGGISDDSVTTSFLTGCTTNDDFDNYYVQWLQDLPLSTCWTEANLTADVTGGFLHVTQDAATIPADVPRESKTFDSADIIATVQIAEGASLSDVGDSCGLRIVDSADVDTGAIIVLEADGATNVVVKKSTVQSEFVETAIFVAGEDSFPGLIQESSIYLRLTQSGGTTSASYRVGDVGEFTPLGTELTIPFGDTVRVDLFITSDGANSAVQCVMDNFTVSGAAAEGQD